MIDSNDFKLLKAKKNVIRLKEKCILKVVKKIFENITKKIKF